VIGNPKTEVWYKKQRLGVNSIDHMMKSIIPNTPLQTSSKRLSNHSAGKTLVKKLRAANVERQSIIQVTGHAKEKSLNDYDEGTEREHLELSHIYQWNSTDNNIKQFLTISSGVFYNQDGTDPASKQPSCFHRKQFPQLSSHV